MSKTPDAFSLQILFDGTQISQEELKANVEKLIQAQLPHIKEFDVKSTRSGLYLSITGPLEIVDKCHDDINVDIIGRCQLVCVRLIDEAGDEVRRRAYPILARIEQNFRVFINRAFTEVVGFDWWEKVPLPREIRAKVKSLRDKDEDRAWLHPLEYTQFDDLVDLITKC